MKLPGIYILALMLLPGGIACGNNNVAPTETYKVAFRQRAPEPVYGRFMWSHLPNPIKPKVAETAPFHLPRVQFDMPDASLEEAVEALAQAMGYRWHFPKAVATRRVRIRMEGTVEEILTEIGNQTGVYGMFDHKERMVKIIDTRMIPRLPAGSS